MIARRLIKQKIPANTEYRKNVEAFTNYRRNIVKQNEDVGSEDVDNAQIKTIEKLIGCGQVEELVQQAKDELSLIEDYYRGRLLGELTCRIQNLGRTEGRESLSVTKWYLLSFFC